MTVKAKKTTGTKVTSIKSAIGSHLTGTECKSAPVDNILISLSPECGRALMMIASAILFSSPSFATQANPNNIVSLGDLFHRFVNGEVTVNQPSDEVTGPSSNGATFG